MSRPAGRGANLGMELIFDRCCCLGLVWASRKGDGISKCPYKKLPPLPLSRPDDEARSRRAYYYTLHKPELNSTRQDSHHQSTNS
eukprot:scaffold1365_cov190-Alexandrium_tamarense.AAC.4